jgi:ATP-dependent Clp protease adaptor protein ClpS
MPQEHDDNIFDGELQVDSEQEVDEPRMYKVLLHNDHYTTMDFVVEVLIKVFRKTAADATRLMLEVHNRGKSICGVYTYDIAVTKAAQVHLMAKHRGFPLKCSYEEA